MAEEPSTRRDFLKKFMIPKPVAVAVAAAGAGAAGDMFGGAAADFGAAFTNPHIHEQKRQLAIASVQKSLSEGKFASDVHPDIVNEIVSAFEARYREIHGLHADPTRKSVGAWAGAASMSAITAGAGAIAAQSDNDGAAHMSRRSLMQNAGAVTAAGVAGYMLGGGAAIMHEVVVGDSLREADPDRKEALAWLKQEITLGNVAPGISPQSAENIIVAYENRYDALQMGKDTFSTGTATGMVTAVTGVGAAVTGLAAFDLLKGDNTQNAAKVKG